ncbi:MAG: glycosyltransferase family 2 protein [Alphaproteobacteria bacterium]|nr:glycosyltransferase family 2 protein [Alphaproteobacteria bacterium]
MPKISVISPIYNTDPYLADCLDHLVKQTLQDMEFIWIDNAANNKCREIINKYKDLRENIRVISLTENIGYSGAMNLGLEKATGDFIGFCDTDDWVDYDYYERLYNAVTDNTDIVYCSHIIEEPNKSNIVDLLSPSQKANSLDVLTCGSIWNGIYKAELIKGNAVSFNKNGKSIYRDTVFAAQVGCFSQNCKAIKDLYYHCMQRKGSTTNGLSLLQRKTATYEILEEIFANPNMSTLAKDKLESLSDLLMRSLPITALEKFPKEAEALTSLAHFKKMYNQTKAFSHPTFLQRLFSVSQHFSKPIKKIRFLGLSFKIKQKKG